MDAPINDRRSPFLGEPADFIPTEGIAGMDADADNISGHDRRRVDRLDRLIDQQRIANMPGCRRRQNEEPSRCNYRSSKGIVAGID